MNTKHTPGPWSMLPEEVDRDYIRIRGTVFGGRYKVANVITPTYEGVLEKEANETRANAKLIAAAPELLEALVSARKEIAGLPHSLGYGFTHLPKIDAAIAKATGAA